MNVTESRVEAVFDVQLSQVLNERQKNTLIERLGAIISASSQDQRSQLRNKEIALERLAEKLRAGLVEAKARRPTRPTRASKTRRLESKRQQAEKKQARRWRED